MKNRLSNRTTILDLVRCSVAHRFIFIAGLFAAFTCPLNIQASAVPQSTKEVLYINSFHRGHTWSDELEKGLRETLLSAGEPIELSVVYLDTLRYQADIVREKVADLLNLKNISNSADLVITSNDAALDFALTNQEKLFPKQPILFTSVEDSVNIPQKLNTTGILEFTSFNTAIELALKLHPETNTIAFVGSTQEPHNQRIVDIIQKDISPLFSSHHQIKIFTDKSIDELDVAFSQLPSNSIVFAISNTLPKSDGSLYSPSETARILSSIMPFPLYTYWHSHIGHGAIGGQIVTGHNKGRAAAQLALQVFNSSDHLPKPKAPPASLFFDIDMMKKFGIRKDDLPEGTQFIHDKPAIWYEYQTEFLTALTLFFALISAILGFILLTQKQKKTIHQLSDNHSNLEKAYDLNQEELADIRQLLKEVNTVDELTGLFNVRYFDEALDKELRRASRYKTPLSLLLISFDHYSSYLKHYGDEVTEEQLVFMSEMLNNICQRSSDIIAFIQPGQFAIILPHTSRENALFVCHKIHEKLREQKIPFILSKTGMVTISIGLSALEGIDQHINPQHMYNTSEMLRISAEKDGGNRTKSDCIRLSTEQSLLMKI